MAEGINVNISCPGYIATELNADLWNEPLGQKRCDGFSRRRVMPTEALDAMLLHLCSDASAFTKGSPCSVMTDPSRPLRLFGLDPDYGDRAFRR